MKDLFLIVDGNSLMHRAFHALPPMDYEGVPTGAIHGFLMMLLHVLIDKVPRYAAVAFDEHAPTFRHTKFADYKAGRQKTPDELVAQLSLIREILPALDLKVFSLAGYEADDILGTVAQTCAAQDVDTLLLTGDRDALQLVREGVSLLFTRKGITETSLFDPPAVKEYFGFTPAQVTDYKGLVGDSSDNIPGVPGVGDKTGVKLLAEYGTMENVLAHAGEIKGKLGEKLVQFKEQAYLSKELATILPTVPIEINLSECTYQNGASGIQTLEKYGLNAVVRQARKLWADAPLPEAEPENEIVLDRPDEELLDTADSIAAFIAATEGQETALCLTDTALSLATETRFGRVVLSNDLLSVGLTPEEAWAAVAPALKRPLITHNFKRLLHAADSFELSVCDALWDTMLAQYLINPQEKSYALSAFTADDAFGILTLKKHQEARLIKEQTSALLTGLELPLSRVLFDMEKAGFRVDQDVLRALGREYAAKTEELKAQIYQLTGVSGFNISSPQQLGKVLFETLGLKAGKKTQRGYSTDADTLEALEAEHPAITPILQYRQYLKFNSTYIDGLLSKTDSLSRVHSYFDQTGTATGRISSSEPNLQNIPVRTALGREIRRAFVAKDGCLLIDADYSQIELRLLAHMSGDKAMIDAFQKGQDIHTRTAAEVYGVALDEVTPQMRSASKAVNFGIVYGISEFGLAKNIGVSRREASDFIARYFARYPAVKQFMEDMKAQGRAMGYAKTLFGRRRLLPELKSPNAVVRAFGDRVAMNMPVQGTAADIIKFAMVRVRETLNRDYPDARLILQVHDELLIEAPEALAETLSRVLKDAMERVAVLSVPLVAEVKYGKSWYETK